MPITNSQPALHFQNAPTYEDNRKTVCTTRAAHSEPDDCSVIVLDENMTPVTSESPITESLKKNPQTTTRRIYLSTDCSTKCKVTTKFQ